VSCIVTLYNVGGRHSKPVVRGQEPAKPSRWKVKAWFVLATGEKHTHDTTAPAATIEGLAAYMGGLIDSLIADHGNEVSSAGWTATTHGVKKK
jgi:hypothetical protein